jgi:hypothetical protein
MVPPETHTQPRQIRIATDLWDELEQAVGTRRRSAVIVEFIRWYLRKPGAKLPRRLPVAADAPESPRTPR